MLILRKYFNNKCFLADYMTWEKTSDAGSLIFTLSGSGTQNGKPSLSTCCSSSKVPFGRYNLLILFKYDSSSNFLSTLPPQTLFGKEADKLEHATDDECTYYIIEKEPLVNKFISVPKDKGSLNCAQFVAGIIQAVLSNCGFVSILSVPFFLLTVAVHYYTIQ